MPQDVLLGQEESHCHHETTRKGRRRESIEEGERRERLEEGGKELRGKGREGG